MNLVDDVYTIFSFRRWVLDLFPDLTDIFDAVVGCGIDLHYIQGCSGQDLFTARTFPAGTSVHRMFAVHRPGQDLRHRCLTCSAGSAEQICVADSAGADLIL